VNFWNWLLIFVLTLTQEVGWMWYIFGIAHRRKWMTIIGNAWIVVTGLVVLSSCIENTTNLIPALAGGSLGILLLWPWLTKGDKK